MGRCNKSFRMEAHITAHNGWNGKDEKYLVTVLCDCFKKVDEDTYHWYERVNKRLTKHMNKKLAKDFAGLRSLDSYEIHRSTKMMGFCVGDREGKDYIVIGKSKNVQMAVNERD